MHTVKPLYNGHSQKDQKLVIKTNYRLKQVKSFAECSKVSILQYCRPSFGYHLSLRSLFCLILSGRLRHVLLYVATYCGPLHKFCLPWPWCTICHSPGVKYRPNRFKMEKDCLKTLFSEILRPTNYYVVFNNVYRSPSLKQLTIKAMSSGTLHKSCQPWPWGPNWLCPRVY